MKEHLGVDTQLLRGERGVFEVSVNGAVVARKTLAGFPTEEEILAAVKRGLLP